MLMHARIDSLETAMQSVSTSLRAVVSKLDLLEQRVNRINKQSASIQLQSAMTTQSDMNELRQYSTSMDSTLKEVQKQTDGKFRGQSESNESKSVKILAMVNQLKKEMRALREAQNPGDEELKEETEEMKLKKWMEDEVKLPQYFELLKEDGFDDLESVQDVTEDDLKAMGINKTGHRRKIIKFVTKLKATNNPLVAVQSSAPEQHAPAAAAAVYSSGVAESAKIYAEGPNVVDTAR